MKDVWALLRELPAEQLPELRLTMVPEEERRSDWRNWAAWPWRRTVAPQAPTQPQLDLV
jgi:hypothetical protein